jgi:hypothetical protein
MRFYNAALQQKEESQDLVAPFVPMPDSRATAESAKDALTNYFNRWSLN